MYFYYISSIIMIQHGGERGRDRDRRQRETETERDRDRQTD